MDGSAPPSASSSPGHLLVVDAANCLYRAFFAIPLLRTTDGRPTNAALGFINMLQKAIRELAPDHVVVVFDAPGPSFRHSAYEAYKATRDAQPEDLSVQLPVVHELVEAYHLAQLEVEGFEADDVIATLVARAPADWRVTILSTDKDLMQLASGRVVLLDTMKERRYGPAEVEARFGVPPKRLRDFRALVGDPSDNIPGVRGVGEKGAAQLIREWGDLETLLEHTDQIPTRRVRETLRDQADRARLSKRLVTLCDEVPVPIGLEAFRLREPDRGRLADLFRRLEFSRLLEELERTSDGTAGRVSPAAVSVSIRTEVVEDEDKLGRLAEALEDRKRIVLVPIGGGESALREEPVGLAFALSPEHAAYVPLAQPVDREQPSGLPIEMVIERLRPLLAPGARGPWGGRDVKGVQVFLGERGMEPAPAAFDVEIAAFLLDPAGARGTAVLASQYLGRSVPTWEEFAGRGARATPAAELPVAETARFAGGEVCAVDALDPRLGERLGGEGLQPLFDEVEMPLTAVLARMERAGIRIDEGVLARLSEEYERELVRMEGEIHALAGERFNVGSPKQLQRILFEKLKLPVVRKTKTGYSTDEAVLEQLAAHHELPARVLTHRRLAKLKSTYVDAIPPLIHPKTGRIHPIFHQTGAATGRLSASQPNVQNIPIRSEEGIRIREAFVPEEGRQLVSADYSQVELRILAHFSEDESLIAAFGAGDDIHRRTAAEVLGLPPEDITAEQRARAKAVNFGIIYGSSAFGIANQLGIATGEAQSTIDAYFERYRGVRRFLDRTIGEARERGFVRTLLGRRRYLSDLGSRNRVLRSAAERMAVNTVIQGTAADLIKKAMVEVDRTIRGEGLAARMILQVHDELVVEVPEAETSRVGELVRRTMESVWALRVPLVAELGVGRSWREAH